MVWDNQSGGNPWGNGSNDGPRRGASNSSLEDMLRRGQKKFQHMMPDGQNVPVRLLLLIVCIITGLWALTGFYQVEEGQQGATLRFGRWIKTTHPGINYHLPYPIESVIVQNVDQINVIDSGVTVKASNVINDENSSNFMLTGDENIVAVNFTIQWYIKDIGAYLFRISEPNLTVKQAAESAMREIVGQNQLEYALTKGRGEIADKAQVLLQKMLDGYQSGIQIVRVQLKSIDPPQQVIDSFRDVQRARADHESKINEAIAYRNTVEPNAYGESAKITQAALAYKKAKVLEAVGRTTRFLAVLKEYNASQAITKQRLSLDTALQVLNGAKKVIIEGHVNKNGVLPYLPLPAIQSEASQSRGSN